MTAKRPWLVRQAGPPARRLWWVLLRARSLDVTVDSEQRSCLVLAAHPDDETLGCAVTIMRKRDNGTPVVLLIASDGRRSTVSSVVSGEELVAIRIAESTAAASILGVPGDCIVRLGLEDARLAEHTDEMRLAVAELIARHRPSEILVTSAFDPHPDHAALGAVARQLVAEYGDEGPRLLEYPVWQWRQPGSWLGVAKTASPAVRLRALAGMRTEVVSTHGYLDRKRAALGAYASQVVNLTGEPEWWSLDRRFLANFFRSHELFLPVDEPAPPSQAGRA